MGSRVNAKKRPLERLFNTATLVELSRVYQGRLKKTEFAGLVIEGTQGILPRMLNKHPRLCDSYEQFGWLGVVYELAGMVNDHEVEPVLAIHCAQAASWFWHLGWQVEHCAYADHNPGWWYIRRARGRTPKACPLHARAARQSRWERNRRLNQ